MIAVPVLDRPAGRDIVLAMAENTVAGLLLVHVVMENVVDGPGIDVEAIVT